MTERTPAGFQTKARKWDRSGFVGVKVPAVTDPVRLITLDQRPHVENVSDLTFAASFKDFVTSQASIACLVLRNYSLSPCLIPKG